MDENTISQVVKDELCTGCGTCIALCPKEAIKLTIDEKKAFTFQNWMRKNVTAAASATKFVLVTKLILKNCGGI